MLRQAGPWTYGALANHIESFAGKSRRSDVSATFIQPFLTYVTPTQTTFAVNTESTYRITSYNVCYTKLLRGAIGVPDLIFERTTVEEGSGEKNRVTDFTGVSAA